MRLRAICISVLALIGSTAPLSAAPEPWRPAPGTAWQIQFTGRLDTTVEADVFDVDMFDTGAATVADLHDAGRHVICYVSAGSWEKWRPDAGDFPKSVLGRALDGWPGEKWLDIRALDVLRPIIRDRIAKCAQKSFDAIEYDNVDGYTNNTGFPLTGRDQLRYNRWLAAEAHRHGLSAGLKNSIAQVRELVDDFDFQINEECLTYNECHKLKPFVEAGKAVLHIEYEGSVASICARSPAGFSTIKKHLDLDAWVRSCAT